MIQYDDRHRVPNFALIAPGRGERAVSDAIRDLAGDMSGVDRYRHKRIVRAGPNILHPYRENPPVLPAD